jgi:serine/threonine protein kinase
MAVRRFLVAGRYRLHEPVGSGGMGRVWLARDEMLDRHVAVKEFVPPDWMTDAEKARLRDRTLREARSAARLNHPHVVRIYDVVHAGDAPWIVMEYVPSRSLHQVINEDGPFAPIEAARIGLAVLDALTAAHRAGVLHRDVKPHNVLIGTDGRVVLTDFGLATFVDDGSITGPGVIVGTPQYVSPERARDGASTVESDLWSLGATLYAAVEGRSPYARESAMATLMALATEPPDPPVLAGPLTPVLKGLLQHEPAERLTGAEVKERLRAIVGAHPVRGQASDMFPGPRRPADGAPPHPEKAALATALPDEAAPPGSDRNATPTPGSGRNARLGPGSDRNAGLGRGSDRNAAPTPGSDRNAAPTPGSDRNAAPTPGSDRNAGPGLGRELAAALAMRRTSEAVSSPPPPRQRQRPGSGSAEPVSAPPAGPEPRRSRLWPALAVVVVVLLAGGGIVAGWAVWNHGDGRRSALQAGPSFVATSAPAVGPTGFTPIACEQPPGSNLPLTPQPGAQRKAKGFALLRGWSEYTDVSGFRVGVPDGWTYEKVGTTVCFRDPNNIRFLSVDASRNPAGDPIKACTVEAARLVRSGAMPNYQLISLNRSALQIKAADWEYTWDGPKNIRMHATTRWFKSGDRAFALSWATRDFDWQINTAFYGAAISSFSST